MENDFTKLGSYIDEAYQRFLSYPELGRELAKRVALECGDTIRDAAALITQNPDVPLNEWSQKTLESYFELAALLVVASDTVDQELNLLNNLINQLDRILNFSVSQKARDAARALLESLILSIEDLHPATSHKILELLATLADAPEGVIPPSTQNETRVKAIRNTDAIDFEDKTLLRGLLQIGLYREVMTFLRQRKELERARGTGELLKPITRPVASFASRKGGVGKSMLVFATAAWFIKLRPSAKVCIIDLDFSGPVWQYLLFPERNRPSHFLNDLLNLTQGNQKGDFEFPDVSTKLIEPMLEESTIDINGTPLFLLSFADLPRTSRYLALAIANNSESCFGFLTQLLSALQPLVDLVVIDNGPGFESLPLLSHVLTTSVPHGCSVVISTPALPDLRGTLIELSDLNVLDRESALVKRPPIWIVNKADEKAEEFLSGKHKIVDVAYEIEAYNRIIPCRPLIARTLSVAGSQFHGLSLPLDKTLLTFGNIKNSGAPPLRDALDSFLETDFFKAFVERIGPLMFPPLSGGDDMKEEVSDIKP